MAIFCMATGISDAGKSLVRQLRSKYMTGSSSRHDHSDEGPSLHYTNPDDCGYVREHISGQDDFIARELDLGDEGGGQKQGGPSFHRFLSSQDGGAGDEVTPDDTHLG